MKLLFDHNLSPKLTQLLADEFPTLSHVVFLGLERSSDVSVWQTAKAQVWTLVTKDSDFNDLLVAYGFPPKVIWVRLGNVTTQIIAQALRQHAASIHAFHADPTAGLLVIA